MATAERLINFDLYFWMNKMVNKNYQSLLRQVIDTIEIKDEQILQRCPAIAPAQIK